MSSNTEVGPCTTAIGQSDRSGKFPVWPRWLPKFWRIVVRSRTSLQTFGRVAAATFVTYSACRFCFCLPLICRSNTTPLVSKACEKNVPHSPSDSRAERTARCPTNPRVRDPALRFHRPSAPGQKEEGDMERHFSTMGARWWRRLLL